MINKQELIKLLSVAMEEKAKLEGQIDLIHGQLRMIQQKEEQLQQQIKEVKEEKEKAEE